MASLNPTKIKEKVARILYWHLIFLKEDGGFSTDSVPLDNEQNFISEYSERLTTFNPAFEVIPHSEVTDILMIKINQQCSKEWFEVSLRRHLDWLRDGFQRRRNKKFPFKSMGGNLYLCSELSGYQLFKKKWVVFDEPVIQNEIETKDGKTISVLLIDLNYSRKEIFQTISKLLPEIKERHEVNRYPKYLQVYRMREGKIPLKTSYKLLNNPSPKKKIPFSWIAQYLYREENPVIAKTKVEKQYRKARELIWTAQMRITGRLIDCKNCSDKDTDKCNANCPILKKQLEKVEVKRRDKLSFDDRFYGGKPFSKKKKLSLSEIENGCT